MSFKKVRDAHKTENTEDYLEIIAELLNSKGEARIVDIANELDIAQATANKTIQRLQNQGFVKKEPYRSIFLTLKGQELASISKKRHIIVLTFLKKLGIVKNKDKRSLKILGTGELKAKNPIECVKVTKSAEDKIKKLGIELKINQGK